MNRLSSLVLLLSAFAISAMGQKVEVQWDKTERISKTTPTLQIVVNPPLRAGSPIRERAYAEVQRLGADNREGVRMGAPDTKKRGVNPCRQAARIRIIARLSPARQTGRLKSAALERF